MMRTARGYVDARLAPGERVLYRANLHWAACAGLPAAFVAVTAFLLLLGVAFLALFFLPFMIAAIVIGYLSYTTSEFAVTDRRVLAKIGWLRRRSTEVLLGKIESIQVDQGLGGRLLDYETLQVTGTGGTRERLVGIESPFEFYKRIQAVMALMTKQSQAQKTSPPDPSLPLEPPKPRTWVRPPWEKGPNG